MLRGVKENPLTPPACGAPAHARGKPSAAREELGRSGVVLLINRCPGDVKGVPPSLSW